MEHLFETSGLTIERVGYSSMDVTRLLRDVATAFDEGRPVEEMIAERELAEVSFGHDRQKVDQFLDSLAASIAAGQDVRPALRGRRLHLARSLGGGYDANHVNAYLQVLEQVLEGKASVDQLRTTRSPAEGGAGVTRKASPLTIFYWALAIAFFIYVALNL